MKRRDEYGYPLTDVLEEGFLPPRDTEERGDIEEVVAHAAAYAAYQERFRAAYMEKVRRRSRGNR